MLTTQELLVQPAAPIILCESQSQDLSHCSLVDFSSLIYWKSPICYLRGIRCNFLGLFGSREKMLLANRRDPDQTLHYAASDLGLHHLSMYPF